MFAVFKKEISIYYLTPFGYIFMGLYLFISSIVFVFYNLFGGKNDLYGMFGIINFISIFLFPILTMKLLSEEKRNSTDQLLFTSPITLTSIILGKYFATLFVFIITLLTTAVFAIFVFIFGNVSIGSILGSYLGFLLLGAAYIAICFFGASLSENQITSVVLSFGFLVGFVLIGFLGNVIPIALIKDIMKWLALVNKYDELSAGILKIEPLIYYISFIIFFIIVSILVLTFKKNDSSKRVNIKIKDFISQINLIIKVVLVIGIIIIVNLIADQLPWSFDMTIDKIFTLSDQSKEVVVNLKKPVSIIVFTQEKKKERLLNILLKEYQKYGGKNIILKYLDAEKNPIVVKQYDKKNMGISNGNIIVECEGRTKRIHNFDIIKKNEFGYGKSFEGEAQITGAILYVTSEIFKKVYFLEGHDETSINNELYKLKNKIENEVHIIEPINLLKYGNIPTDADSLVIVSPKRDLSFEEKIKIETYLDKGGRLLFLLDISSSDTKLLNFNNLMSKFGIVIQNNFIVEENASRYYSNNKMYVIPDYTDNVITEKLKSKNLYVMLPYPGNIDISNNKKGDLTVKTVLKSSDKSWIRYNIMDATPTKGENDVMGPANLAVSIVKDNVEKKNKNTKIIIIYNGKFITDNLIDLQGNFDFFMNSINWLEDSEESITIRPKIMDANIMMLKGSQYIVLIIITVFIIPVIIFILGFIVWRSRKNL